MSLTADEIKTLRDELVARGRVGHEVTMGLRTEVHARLQLAAPFPTPADVTDDHRIAADHAKQSDPQIKDALHWLQKQHGMALWKETDRLIAAAGV